MTPRSTLSGRIALVTGASRGIGRAVARRLAAHDAVVIAMASERSADALRQVCVQIRESGGRAHALTADLADPEARQRMIERILADHGRVEIVVNNAATITAFAPPSRIDLPARQAMFEVNFQAPVDLIQAFVPGMRESGWGRIINISSDTTAQPPIPYPGPAKFVHALGVYGASKAALERYTLALAAELHGTGLCANAVAPVKIAWSESADAVAREAMKTHPDWVEPLTMMAEATYLLAAGSLNGFVGKSRELLQLLQQPLHDLDGQTVIGDAHTLASDQHRS